uniref:Toll-like receptor 2 type-2-like n=1 Tax=Saccoglossus kowalevskii TaxID=10224 RepID=A0ABM0N1E8_SACKO|nr:PREDICTED: toll-like receptor 2 type-2-like [Saccoglossus kowalevskii]
MEEDDDVFSLQVESTDLPSEPLEDYDAESPVLDWELQDTHTEHFFVQTEEEHHVESDSTEGGIEISPVVSTTPDSICSMAPPLVGKETSHVFFCYSPSDNEWVANVVRKLESPAYGFKCYNHELVCEPEKSKADLILSCTCCCKKVVVVLSSAFLESAWCQLDNAYVIQQLIKDTNKIIVVALNDCNAPHYLQHFVPVNAMSKSFWPRFIASLKQEIFVDVVNSFSNEHAEQKS